MTTYHHTPAHTTNVPDEYTDEATGEVFTVLQDEWAEDPHSWIETEHASVYVYGAPFSHSSDSADDFDNVAVKAFERYYDWGDDNRALQLTQRYLAAYHPDLNIKCDIFSITGYSQGDWCDVFVAVTDGYGTPESHADTFGQYFRGDVWIVSNGEESLGGIYAESQEEAIEAFKSTYR